MTFDVVLMFKMQLLFCFLLSVLALARAAPDPTLYQYYSSGGIHSGLNASSDQFTLNSKPYVIYSGSFHYFRVVPEYWRPVLQRFKAAGLNAVQLYLPWNLHEELPGRFDFESPWLNLDKFLQEIKLADMFAIVRPGPYICAEWEFGGFPSWLLRDPHMKLRSAYPPYLERVKQYWDQALKIINKHQFSISGGPVIALQIENEYFGAFWMEHSAEYLHYLRDITRKGGFKELLFTSDPGFAARQLPIKNIFPLNGTDQVLETANLNRDSLEMLTGLRKSQPNRPAFVTEFWPGWFDSWSDKLHHTYSVQQFDQEVSDVLFKVNGSINFYMFIGGTNFGFTNGGGIVTSYDYDAPLSESGNYTPKYHKTRELYQKLVSSGRLPRTQLPDVPIIPPAHAYGSVEVEQMVPLEAMLELVPKFSNIRKPVPMELLNHTESCGQRFGFVLYRVEAKQVNTYNVTGQIADRAIFMVQGASLNHTAVTPDSGEPWLLQVITYPVSAEDSEVYKFDLLVENMGRANGGDKMDLERKGILSGDVKLDGNVINNLTVYSLEFDSNFMQKLNNSTKFTKIVSEPIKKSDHFPAMYRAQLKVDGEPRDTYLHLPEWNKGNVFVNGFNLGRYWSVGPQQTMYIPAPLLKTGQNWIDLFELHKPGRELHFVDSPILQDLHANETTTAKPTVSSATTTRHV